VRLRIPLKRIEEEEDAVDPETGEEYKVAVEKFVEIEIDDKLLMVPARVDQLPYSIYVINQSAPKW
jgi:hypothetical protein